MEQAQERYLTQILIAHSGKQHAHLRRSLADDYTKGHDNYPDTRQDALRRLNTRSSTEAEMVTVDDCMPAICWTRYFLQAQGYAVNENIVYQDNKSAIAD
jgi:hypothetical protein